MSKMQDAEENVRGSEVVKTEHLSVIENALFFVYKANCSEDLSALQCDVWLTPVLLIALVDVPLIEVTAIGAVKLQALLA